MPVRLLIVWIALGLGAAEARGEAGEILGGIGAIIDAGAPIAIAGIQAGADKAIASINADAAIQMTQIQADTTKYIADNQKDVAIYQALTAQKINLINQEGVTERLAMQLNELRDARREAAAAEREKMALEFQYNSQRIALAREQAADQRLLAQQFLSAQTTIAGLSFGYNPGSRLTITRAFESTLAPSDSAPPPATPPPSSPSAQTATLTELAPTSASPRASAPAAIARPSRVLARGGNPRGRMPARLLASVGQGKVARARTGLLAQGPIKSPYLGVGRGLRNAVARGSFPGVRMRVAVASLPPSRSFSGIPHRRAGGFGEAGSAGSHGIGIPHAALPALAARGGGHSGHSHSSDTAED